MTTKRLIIYQYINQIKHKKSLNYKNDPQHNCEPFSNLELKEF